MLNKRVLALAIVVSATVLLGAAIAQAGDSMATVRVSYSDRADGVFPVRVVKINGEESAIARGREVIEIPAGQNTLTVQALIDQRWVRGPERRIDFDSEQSVSHTFRAGETYYIAAKMPGESGSVDILVGEWDARGER